MGLGFWVWGWGFRVEPNDTCSYNALASPKKMTVMDIVRGYVQPYLASEQVP